MTKSIRDLSRERSYQIKAGIAMGHGAPKVHWPLIAVSRERGAGGGVVARNVANQFQFSFWDRDLLHRVAEESGTDECALSIVDEHSSSGVSEFFQTLLMGAEYTQAEYLGTLTNVLLGIARRGGAVVMGRGAHLMLRAERVLRVRIVCPFEIRVERVMHKEGLSHKEAAHRLHQCDADAAGFIRHNFHEDINLPTHYDLVINTGGLSHEAAEHLIVDAYASRFGAVPEQAEIQTRVSVRAEA